MIFTFEFILLLICILLSSFFSACETSFLSISNLRLHSLLEKNVRGAQSLYRLRQKRRRVLIALLIGNNITNITASALATTISIALFGNEGLGIAIGVMSFVMLTLGDIMPKSFATSYGEQIMLLFSPVVEAIYYILFPLVIVFELINRLVPGMYSRATGIERFTEDEIKTIIKLGATHRTITDKEREMIENVLSFNDKTVAQVMTPKERVVYFPHNMSVGVAHAKAIASLYYRFPILKNGVPIGTINIRTLDCVSASNPKAHVETVAQPMVVVKTYYKLNEAFTILQEAKRHFAVVMDSKNEFAGVITMDDLLEQLVGKIKIV